MKAAALLQLRAGDPISRKQDVEACVEQMLIALGLDVKDPNFVETPRRFASYLLGHFMSYNEFADELEDFKRAVFPSSYRGMVTQRVTAIGMCPHHLLPVFYDGVVAYIPHTQAIGLSKLTRIAQLCLRTPSLQEDGTVLIADILSHLVGTDNVAVALHGQHQCMTARGVKEHDPRTQTSEVRGMFMDRPEVRAEFMAFVQIAATSWSKT